MAERERQPSVVEALEGHVTLDIECFDRMVFNAYVPLLQSGGGVVTFLREHRGNPIPSPALFAPIGERFRTAVRRFAEEHEIPLVPFRSRQDKLATVRPHLEAAAAADQGDFTMASSGLVLVCLDSDTIADRRALRVQPISRAGLRTFRGHGCGLSHGHRQWAANSSITLNSHDSS